MKKAILFLLFISIIVNSCRWAQKDNKEAATAAMGMPNIEMLRSITEAHKVEAFHQKEIIAFDIELYFRDKLRLEGTIYSRTNSSAVLVKKTNGTELLFDGREVFISPDTSSMQGARFDALTWSYFALAPFKFLDEGTNWELFEPLPLEVSTSISSTLKLSFGEKVGDAPDDWYIIFQDDASNFVKAMVYIVTFGETSQDEASKNPHAIVYNNYININGIPFSHEWKFYNWNEDQGLASQIGEAQITNMRFMQETDSLFMKKANSQLVPLPN